MPVPVPVGKEAGEEGMDSVQASVALVLVLEVDGLQPSFPPFSA